MNPSNTPYWVWPQQHQQHQQHQQQQHQAHSPQRRILPQEPYSSPSHTTSPIALQNLPIVFLVNGQPGIRVSDALNDNFNGLAGADAPLNLPELIQQKITFRIQVIGYPKFEKQKYIRAVADNTPITMAKLSRRAAEAVQDFIQEMVRRQVVPEPGSVRFGSQPGAISLDNLYIDFLEQKSRGSFQPQITYWA